MSVSKQPQHIHVAFSEEAFKAPIHPIKKENGVVQTHIVVCNAETGDVFKGTALLASPFEDHTEHREIIGEIPADKVIHIETTAGRISPENFAAEMTRRNFSEEERRRATSAYDRFVQENPEANQQQAKRPKKIFVHKEGLYRLPSPAVT